MKAFFALLLVFSSAAFAAPKAQLSNEDIVRTVLKERVVLKGTNAKGDLGADSFAYAHGHTKAGAALRLNDAAKSFDASSNPEQFHLNLALSTAAGVSPTIRLQQVGKPVPAARVNTRIVRFAMPTPMTTKYAGKGRLVATVGQSLNGQKWMTNFTYVTFESK